jgi:hypothetical protein
MSFIPTKALCVNEKNALAAKRPGCRFKTFRVGKAWMSADLGFQFLSLTLIVNKS